MEILRELIIQPRVILVETHGVYGAPTEVVASLLEDRGYIVSHRGLAEPRLPKCAQKMTSECFSESKGNTVRARLGLSKSVARMKVRERA